MKPRTNHTYGKRRVYTRLAHMVDPLLLACIDRLAEAASRSRAEWIRDAIYSAVVRAVRAQELPEAAPLVPYDDIYINAPRLRLHNQHLCVVDEDGIRTDRSVVDYLKSLEEPPE